jgi:hypothetical protein
VVRPVAFVLDQPSDLPVAEFSFLEVDEVLHDDEQWHHQQLWTKHPCLLSWEAEWSAAFSSAARQDASEKEEAVDYSL